MNRSIPSLRGVLFVGAHPDDETIMAGGILVMLHKIGIPAHIVCVTDGQGGEAGGIPEAEESRAALARIRASELREAAVALGAESCWQLGYVDPIVGENEELRGFAVDENKLVQQIAELINQRGVDVVLTHGTNGEYGHPAHIQVHRAVKRAVQEYAAHVMLYTVSARVPGVDDRIMNVSDPAHVVLDITPWSEAKLAAMMSHRTQHELFKRRRKLETVCEAMRLTEAVHRHHPPVPPGKTPDDPFIQTLLAAGGRAPDLEAKTG